MSAAVAGDPTSIVSIKIDRPRDSEGLSDNAVAPDAPGKAQSTAAVSEAPSTASISGARVQASISTAGQWALVYSVVNAYYCVTSVAGSVFSFLCWVAYYVFLGFYEIDCDHRIWYVSVVIFGVRLIDTSLNLCSVLCTVVPTRRQFFRQIIESMLIATLLVVLALVQASVAATYFGHEGEHCNLVSAGYLTGALALAVMSALDLIVWCFCLYLWLHAPAHKGNILDKTNRDMVPNFLRKKAAKAVEKQMANERKELENIRANAAQPDLADTE